MAVVSVAWLCGQLSIFDSVMLMWHPYKRMKFRNPQETLRKCFPKLIRKSSGKLNQKSFQNVITFLKTILRYGSEAILEPWHIFLFT